MKGRRKKEGSDEKRGREAGEAGRRKVGKGIHRVKGTS